MKLLITTLIIFTFITTSSIYANETDLVNSYTEACNNGDVNSCNNLANIYSSGLLDVDIDYTNAFELYSFTCDRNSFTGCVNLAGMYAEGEGVKQNYKKAIRIYSDACETSIGTYGCVELGRIYLNNEAVDIDYEKALRLFKMSCNSDDSDCIDYSQLYDKLCVTNPQPFCPKSKY